jgi:hypothetical protein
MEVFDGCHTRGVLAGAPPLRIELYSDILLALRLMALALMLMLKGEA